MYVPGTNWKLLIAIDSTICDIYSTIWVIQNFGTSFAYHFVANSHHHSPTIPIHVSGCCMDKWAITSCCPLTYQKYAMYLESNANLLINGYLPHTTDLMV